METSRADECKAQLEEMVDLRGGLPAKPGLDPSDGQMADSAAWRWLQSAVDADHSLLVVGM